MEDFIKELGYLGFATRMKRLSDNLMQEGRRMYQELDMPIEPNWYLLFKILKKHGELGVTEIAQKLQLAHPSVITICNKMEQAGLLVSVKCSNDSRKRVLSLSEKAIENMPAYEKVWDAGIKSVEEALDDLNILTVLDHMEERFQKRNFHERTVNILKQAEKVEKEELEIIDYESRYAADFANINIQWLEAYFYVEEYDKKVLTQAEKYILEPGGHILFARLGEKIVGTVALILREEGDFELSKMGVLEGYRGYKIGQHLMDAAIAYCQKLGKKRVWLDSNRKLTPAIRLYEKNGFEEIAVDPNTPYERCNIRMEKWL